MHVLKNDLLKHMGETFVLEIYTSINYEKLVPEHVTTWQPDLSTYVAPTINGEIWNMANTVFIGEYIFVSGQQTKNKNRSNVSVSVWLVPMGWWLIHRSHLALGTFMLDAISEFNKCGCP